MNRASVALLLVLLAAGTLAPAHAATVGESVAASRVMKVIAVHADGTRELGSAVSIVGEQFVTNCHVIARATTIEIEIHGVRRPVKADLEDRYRDLCFIRLPGYRAEPIVMADVEETRVGLEVFAAGYSAGRLVPRVGRIVGLHTCECDGGKVIQTSAAFDRGASGGGLFDDSGRLIGILTFKTRSGGNFHFALPVGWLRHLADHPEQFGPHRDSFWKHPGKESGYFLAACGLGDKQAWRALAELATEWSENEPNNPEAWMARGRADRGLGHLAAAMSNFRRVLLLDSTHAEAQWALEAIELEQDVSPVDTGRM
ncbi:MAG: trypsin-like peptidase domain-containing protein [Thiobacillus sp.]|nr:trypsin-like peptidase domain-containing protein [Thiobacillus sp.]